MTQNIIKTHQSHHNSLNLARIKGELAARLDQLVFELFGNSVNKGPSEFRLGSIDGEPGHSLKITRRGTNAGLWNDFNPAGSGSGDVIALIQRRYGFTFKETITWACEWLGYGASESESRADTTLNHSIEIIRPRPANREFLARRQKRLRDHSTALEWLANRGIQDVTIEAFHLGLSESYTDRDGKIHQDALVAPVISPDGLPINRTVYYNIPKVTLNPASGNGWMKGPPMTYYAEAVVEQNAVLVCEGLKDLWRTWQSLRDSKRLRDLLLISSTHGSVIPEEWKASAFWDRFHLIFLGHDNDASGDKTARTIAQVAGYETLRVRPLKGKDWTDFWQNGGTVTEFDALLAEASVIGEDILIDVETSSKPGRYEYKPIDIATAFHQGHLYYPVRTLTSGFEVIKQEDGVTKQQLVTRIETVVVRSDRTVHSVKEEPAPKGTLPEDRVLRLTDGMLIESRPKASIYTTWSWASINAYREGRSVTKRLGDILKEVGEYLRQSVWLPYEWDYDMLTLLVPVTYAQAIFQSVPMILVVDPPGSGKSALGRAMVRICANAASIGQASAAGVARLIHETKGFVVMDDLESVGTRSGKDASQFNELIQALKLSYNKETSWKIWTDVSRGMRVERLNFFGVKMINNTTGADNILGSRMLRVQTRKLPEELRNQVAGHENLDATRLNHLRDELHTWTFEQVALIDDTYKRLFPQPSDRAAEIAAPLRVFAEIAGDPNLIHGLDQALSLNQKNGTDPDDPIEVMKEAMRRLVSEGYREISTTHVVLEMKTLMDQNAGRQMTNEIAKWEDPAWVGRQLRVHDIINANSHGVRHWLFGKSLRIYPVKEHFVADVLSSEIEGSAEARSKRPTDFCAGCAQCRYSGSSCPIMDSRLKVEKQRKKNIFQ